MEDQKKPDNIVYNESSGQYDAKIKPYGTNIGAPAIKAQNTSNWQNQSINQYNHDFSCRMEELKSSYNRLMEEFNTNQLLYSTKFNFEPIIGETYHLYRNDSDQGHFLSLIPPNSWKREYLGSFRLNQNKVWGKQVWNA